MMRTRMAIAVWAVGAVLAMSAASVRAENITITSTGGSAKGFIKAVMESFHALWRETYPGISATFKPSSVAGGMIAVATGKADISAALPQVEARAGVAGLPPFKESLKGKIGAMFTIVDKLEFFAVADKNWADKHGIRTFADIAAKKPPIRLNLNTKGTFYAIEAAKVLFKQYGFTLADVEKWGGTVVYSASGAQIQNFRDGKIDMIYNSSLHPDGRMLSLMKSRQLVWIDASADKIAAAAKEIELEVSTVKKGTYAFVTNDEPTMSAWLTMSAGMHVPADTIYKLVKASAENLDRVRAIHPMLKKIDSKMMIKKPAVLDYHPGAAKYYRERGWIK